MTVKTVKTDHNATSSRQPDDATVERTPLVSPEGIPTMDSVSEYLVDAGQRTLLFLDVLRERGDRYFEHQAQAAPNVLKFRGELIVDGRTLPSPVNYWLVRIIPDPMAEASPTARPVVVVDPRAGHGPGIGGFKADSEIGVCLKAGHPCYFIGFLPRPEPHQTIESVLRAEETFLETVISRHPDAEGKPYVIGNCQAGWAMAMLASVRPDLFGILLMAGSPLSYWSGVRGKNPMRYSGGLLGGSWLTALTGDMGAGIFDGAWLVSNFENLNPANTLWKKQYNVWSNVEAERQRYLDFETYWSGTVLLNAEEMQWIVDNLFVGNRLSRNGVTLSDGTPVDMRAISAPIVCFCSRGDNITPPQQALGWILDLYQSVEDILAHNQVIIYAIHEKIGHLGIFVSGAVAKREYHEFTQNIDFIDCLPPGLYEAVLRPTEKDEISSLGDFVLSFETRTLDDIRALGINSTEDEAAFTTVARVSEINLGLYRTFMQPWLQSCMSPTAAEAIRKLHPGRLIYEVFSSKNPAMEWVRAAAEQVIGSRNVKSTQDNFFTQMERQFSSAVVSALDHWRDSRDAMIEAAFFFIYGSPLLQASVGLAGAAPKTRPHPAKDPVFRRFVEQKVAELRGRITKGGVAEAFVRSILYIALPEKRVNERTFNVIRRLQKETPEAPSMRQFKKMLREQYFMLLIDEEAALNALPSMLPADASKQEGIIKAIKAVVASAGDSSPETKTRLQKIEAVLQANPRRHSATNSMSE